MTHTKRLLKFLPFIMFAVLFGASVVYAQNSNWGGDSHGGDIIVQRDRATYSQLGLDTKFNINFQNHVRVCTAAAGQASCDARVIADSNGVPITSFDRSSKGGGSSSSKTPALPPGKSPAQLLKAYNLSGQASGHPTIAIVDAYDDPNIASDLSTYSTTFGIPALPACSGAIASLKVACFEKVNQSGQTKSYPAGNSGWALEIALDVETAHATCQNCSILLVEASTPTFTNLMASIDEAVALGAKVVSNSWGSAEFSGENTYDSHLNHPGVAITFSAGDGGYGAEYPAASPFVTAVGGTSLFLNADNSYNSEVAWSGTGSGCSIIESKPGWQKDSGCAKRTVVDVSADADPNTGAAVYDTVTYAGMHGWFQVGGTSLASPIIAATYALSGNTAGAASSIPYSHTANLHDVKSGTNGSCGGSYLCTALAGYDGPTGLGSPSGTGAF